MKSFWEISFNDLRVISGAMEDLDALLKAKSESLITKPAREDILENYGLAYDRFRHLSGFGYSAVNNVNLISRILKEIIIERNIDDFARSMHDSDYRENFQGYIQDYIEADAQSKVAKYGREFSSEISSLIAFWCVLFQEISTRSNFDIISHLEIIFNEIGIALVPDLSKAGHDFCNSYYVGVNSNPDDLLDPNQRNNFFNFRFTLNIAKKYFDNLSIWKKWFETIQNDDKFMFRCVLTPSGGNNLMFKHMTLVVSDNLKINYSLDFTSNQLYSCHHELSMAEINNYYSSEDQWSHLAELCDNCNFRFLHYLYYLMVEKTPEEMMRGMYYQNGNYSLLSDDLQNKSPAIDFRQPQLVNISNGKDFILDTSTSTKLGFIQKSVLVEDKMYIEIVGVTIETRIIKLQYDVHEEQLAITIDDIIPDLSILISYIPNRGFIDGKKISQNIPITSTNMKIQLHIDVTKYTFSGTLLQNRKIIDSKQGSILYNPKYTMDIETRINQLCDKIEYFKGFYFKLKSFLDQFTEEEKRYVMTIIEKFEFYNISDYFEDFIGKIRSFEISRRKLVNSYAFYISTTSDLKFKSSDIILSNVSSMIPDVHRLIPESANQTLEALECANDCTIWIYMIDDISGTGKQISDRLTEVIEILNTMKFKYRIFLITLYMYQQSYDTILATFPDVRITYLKRIIPTSEKILEKAVFRTKQDKDMTKKILAKYGTKQYASGFSNFGGSLLISETKISNLVPHMFWKTTGKWIPLFFR